MLRPVAPFRLDLTAWALRRRANNAVDLWNGNTYRRAIVIGRDAVEIAATQTGTAAHPSLEVDVSGRVVENATIEAAMALLERALGLRVQLAAFYRMARADAHLGALAAHFRGVKPPRFPSVFEAVVNGIACQQLSLTVGIILLNRLTERCGVAVGEGSPLRAFPRPSDVASLRAHDLRELGFSSNKTRALLELSQQVAAGLDLEGLAELDDDDAIERLLELRGIGRWTAEYVLLRGLGRLTLFPGDDVGARTNLRRWLKLREPLDYDRVRRLSRRWRPYAGFLYFHLLLRALEEAGIIDPGSPRVQVGLESRISPA